MTSKTRPVLHAVADRSVASTAVDSQSRRLNPEKGRGFAGPFRIAAIAAAIVVLGSSAQAATIFKADNTDDLNLATSWTNGVAPTAADVAQWNATVTGPNSVLLGADVSWKGITVTTPGGPVTIGAGNTLTLGTSGITLSAATQDLTISSGLSLGVGNQIWNVAASRTLTLDTGSFSRATGATLNVQGSGTVTPATLANNSAGIIGAWATTGTGSTTRYATISGGNVIGYTGNSVADATLVTDTTGTKVYSVGGAGALTGNSFYALRYFGSTNATISGNCTNNGFMSAGAGNLTISGGVTIGASQELDLTCVNGTMTLSGIIANNPSGASALVKNGSSQLNIGSGSAAVVNTYTGGTWINDGKLQINDNAGSGALGSSDIFVGSGAQLVIRPSTSLPNNNITIGGSTAISLSGANFTMGGLLTLVGNASTTVGNSSGVNQFTFNGGINLNSYTLTMGAGDASQTHNNSINSAITGTGGLTLSASSLTSGTMNLTLGASNSFSGDTTLSVNASVTSGAANLKLNNVNALRNSTLNTGSADTHKQVTFVVAGANTYNLGGLKGADDLAIGLNNINVGGNGQNTAFAGIISSTGGGLIKSGAGMLTLSNLNTYTGATTISNGTLALADGAGIASDLIANYGTFDVSAISGGYHLTTGKTLSGAGNVTGPMTVDSGATLTVGGNSGTAGVGTMTVTGDLTLNGTTVLRLNKGGTSDQIAASGALNLGGTINLNSVGTALANGDQFQIFSAGNSGTPTITGNPGSGLEWDSSLLNSSGIVKIVAGSNPPVFAEPLTNQTVECGSDATFYALATGTAPLVYTWKVNGTDVQSGTDLTTFTTNNVHSAGSAYTVSVQVSNLVNSATSTCTLTVADTLAPVITLVGFSPMSVLQGQTFVDPGATALDSCADIIAPTVSGTVDTSVLGAYALTYTAGDGNGNTNSVIRTVNVVEYQSGVWTNRVGGTLTWLEGTNWSDNLLAQGRDAVADFSTVNIAANTSVRLEQPLTIGDMIFGDTSGAQTWSLGNGGNVSNILTLDSTSGSSTITANTDTSISLQLAGTNKLIKAGTATLTLSASNSYSGGTLLSAGNVKVAATNANSVFGSGDVTIASGVQIWDNVASASDRVWSNNLTIAGDGGSGAGAGANSGVIYLNSGVDLILNGTLILSDNSRLTAANSVNVGYVLNGDVNLDAYTLTLRGGATSLQPDWAINGNVSGAGGGGLAWSAGNANSMLTLSGSNTYNGVTTNNAILTITSTNALPGWDTAGRYSIAGAGTLAVGNDVDDSSILTILGTGNLAANAKIGFYTAAGDRNCPLNLSDTGAGALGLTKVGNNTLTLSGLNTYTGVTKVNGGVLLIPATTALPGWDTDGRYSVANGATLAVVNAVSDTDIATILATTNFVAGARIGFDTTAGNRSYPNILANTSAGSLGLNKLGNNTLTLPAVNTYSGATVVSGGVLAVNGSTAGGSVTVSSNATLSGYGLIKGAVTIQGGGNLSLGSSIGVLTISNGLTLQANSATVMKLAKGSSPANDQVGGIRTLTFGGTLTVTTNVGMAALAAGDSFQLFQATNFVGSFQATNLPTLAAGLAWDTSTLSNGVLSVVASSVTMPPPAILTSATRSGNNLVLVWNGGTNSSGTLLTATNVAQSLATWTPVWTNAVGADGLSTNTLPINFGEPKRFYLLSIP